MPYQKTLNQDLGRKSMTDFHAAKKNPLVLVLDNIRSMQNVGSFFRTADAFLIEEFFLCGITPCPPHRDIHKSALGATDSVAWTYCKDIVEQLQILRSKNYTLIAIEQTPSSIVLHNYVFDHNKKYAFIFGNEMHGVQEQVFPFVDACIEIPQYGTKHSLNVSVCAGICLWDFVRQTLPDLATVGITNH